MDKKLSFGVEGFSVIDDYSDNQLAIVEVYVCHDGNNAHDMPIDLSVIKKAKRTLKNKFLVAGFDGDDFEGHEPDEQIVGFFPESSEMKFVEKDGRNYLVAQAIMSKVYAKWAYDVFVEDEDNERAVSMEITVLGTEISDEDGLEHITKFVFNGVTLLGETHTPACEGANASIIKFSKENALKVYSKRLKNSEKIKKNFVKDMELAEGSGKEESEKMDEKEKEVVETVVEEEATVETPVTETEVETTVENAEVETEDVATEEFAEETNSDEDTYMEDEESDKSEDESDKEDEDKDEDDEDEEGDDKEEDMEANKDFESLTVEQKYEVFRSAVKESLGCGYLESFDDEYLYVYDYCEGYTYKYSYSLEGTTCTIDSDSKGRVMRGGYVDFEVYEQEANKFEALEKENCELKEKLVAYETAEKEKSVEAILSEVVEVIPAERVAELREKAAEFSLDNLSVFENEVKAIAFEAVASKVKSDKYSFTRMTISESVSQKTSKYGW